MSKSFGLIFRARLYFLPPRRHISRRANSGMGPCVSGKKSSRNEALQTLRASAQKFSRHESETPRAMSRIIRGGVAAKRQFLGGLHEKKI